MTYKVGVEITADASRLKQEVSEARSAADSLGTALDGVGAKATGAANKLDTATAATNRLGAAERGATGATNPGSGAGPGSSAPGSRPPTSTPSPSSPTSPPPRPAPTPGARPSLRSDQWSNLGYQANDIATTLAMGMSPMMVLTQQGPQVAQILADAPGGIAGGLKIVADRAMSILTPVRLLTAGFVGLGGTVAYLGYQWAQSQGQIEKGLTGIGAMSRATVGDINRIAEAATSGSRLSTGQARGVATAIASTGRVDVSNIGAVTGLAPGYAEMFGKSIGDAGEDLARIFADPIKGAEELNARIGGLDASTQRYIRSLVEQGQQQRAVTELVSKFSPELQKAAEKMSIWARARNVIGSGFDAAGEFVAGVTGNGASLQDQAKEARTQYMLARSRYGVGLGAEEGPEVKALREAYEKAQQRVYDRDAEPDIKLSAARSITAEGSVRSALPDLDQLDQLRNRIIQLSEAQGDLGALAGMSAEGRRGLVTAIEATQGAVDTFISTQDRARASETLTIRSIEARTEAEKAAVAAERERLALAGQAISESDRRQRIEAARAASFAQGTREAQDRLTDARDRAVGAGLPSYQRQLAELEARTRKALRGAEGNLPAYAATQQTAAAERAAIDAEAIGGPLRDANRTVTEQASALRIQQQAFGASTEAAARMAAAQQLVNQYLAAGVPITADLMRGIDAYAASAGRVAAASEDLARRQREVVGGLDDVRYGLRGGITGIFSDVAGGRSPLDGILNAANRTASSMVDRMISGPLSNMLLGQEGKPGGGLLGDTLGGWFGKAAGLPRADITAGVVNLSGPIAGIPGLTAANGNVPSAVSVAAGLGGKSSSDLERYAQAIRTVESGSAAGNYGAIGPLTKSGDRAYGAYQVMGRNIPSWTKDALGRTMTPEEFLGSREAQDAVFQKQFGASVAKYGNPQDAASVWFTGRPQSEGAGASDILKTTGAGYVAKFNRALPPQIPTATSATSPAVSGLDASLRQIETSATSASQGVASLGSDLTALPGPLAQTSQGLTQVGNSLGSGGGGGGLLGAIASLFGGGSGSAPTAVAAATGGHIRGPGTGTSDSIPAWLSDGEFVVKASATKQWLPVLHAINENRMPAFAAGGPVGAMRGSGDASGAGGLGSLQVNIIGAPSEPMAVRQSQDANGQRRLDVVFDEASASAISRAGSRTSKALSQRGMMTG